eukprot:379807_1
MTQSSYVLLVLIRVQIIQCLGSLALMPFHIENKGGYCIETEKEIKFRKSQYNFLLVQFLTNNEIQLWLNTKASWEGAKEFDIRRPHPLKAIQFILKKGKDKIKVKSRKGDTEKSWLMPPQPDTATFSSLPIKVAE